MTTAKFSSLGYPLYFAAVATGIPSSSFRIIPLVFRLYPFRPFVLGSSTACLSHITPVCSQHEPSGSLKVLHLKRKSPLSFCLVIIPLAVYRYSLLKADRYARVSLQVNSDS